MLHTCVYVISYYKLLTSCQSFDKISTELIFHLLDILILMRHVNNLNHVDDSRGLLIKSKS